LKFEYELLFVGMQMVEMASLERHEALSKNYNLTEEQEVDPNAPRQASYERSDSEDSETLKGAAMMKMKKLAQKFYDTTPGITDCK